LHHLEAVRLARDMLAEGSSHVEVIEGRDLDDRGAGIDKGGDEAKLYAYNSLERRVV